jgi:predicted pyridoxine 5'-phosphate oxidase superfamily flavin-nucleotide-binding protein
VSASQLELLGLPNWAVMATTAPNGKPSAVPIWYAYRGDGHLVLSIASENSRGNRLAHLRDNPFVAVTVIADHDEFLCLEGVATKFAEDVDLEVIDEMAWRYTGAPYPDRSARTIVIVQLDRTEGSTDDDSSTEEAA